jgi:hypothetical protein
MIAIKLEISELHPAENVVAFSYEFYGGPENVPTELSNVFIQLLRAMKVNGDMDWVRRAVDQIDSLPTGPMQ